MKTKSRSHFRPFILKIILFSALGYLVLFLFNQLESKDENSYLEAIIDKQKLLENTPTPRILLVGGSNLAFGVDSERLSQKFRLPVVNTSLYAGLGYNFMLSHLEQTYKKGDIVLISMEYFLGEGNPTHKRKAASYLNMNALLIETRPIEFLKVNKKQIQDKVKTRLKERISKTEKIGTIYERHGFNQNGDFIAHLDLPKSKNLSGFAKVEYEHWAGIERLNETKKLLEKKDAHCFFIFPNYPESLYAINQEAFSKLETDIEQKLDMEVIGSTETFVLPDSLFYDTIYHLGKKGRSMRTEMLISTLKNNKRFMSELASQ